MIAHLHFFPFTTSAVLSKNDPCPDKPLCSRLSCHRQNQCCRYIILLREHSDRLGFTPCHWLKKQAKMEHFLSTLALRGHSNLANLSFLFVRLFDFQIFSIYNVLFIVGCRGERTVCIFIGAHHDKKHPDQKKGTTIQSSFGG